MTAHPWYEVQHSAPERDVYDHTTPDGGLPLCLPCARKRRADGELVEVGEPRDDAACADCGCGMSGGSGGYEQTEMRL